MERYIMNNVEQTIGYCYTCKKDQTFVVFSISGSGICKICYKEQNIENIRKKQWLLDRIRNYLGNGGLFNPELMEHDKVRELIIDCRNFIESA